MSTETVVLFIFIDALIFLVCREVICWYYKINHIVILLESILKELKKINLRKPTEEVKPTKPLNEVNPLEIPKKYRSWEFALKK